MLRLENEYELCGLLTTVVENIERVAMHAVRSTLLEAQAVAAGLPLWRVDIPWPCSNEIYEERMRAALARARGAGIEYIAFGDLYLEDIRAYRERMLEGTGITPLFPLWRQPTDDLAKRMTAAGLRARITCVDSRQLDPTFAGRLFDATFLSELPAGVDPCGERGEFHTFALSGPMFEKAIDVVVGDIVDNDGYVYADLVVSPQDQTEVRTRATRRQRMFGE